jgi:hypothetical protein
VFSFPIPFPIPFPGGLVETSSQTGTLFLSAHYRSNCRYGHSATGTGTGSGSVGT